MVSIDLSQYIKDKGFINVDILLEECGFLKKTEVFCTRIDTVAIAQILQITTKTLHKYIHMGLISLGGDGRMSLDSALELRKRNLRQEAKLLQPVPSRRQRRNIKR